jgi:hypothetical protein
MVRFFIKFLFRRSTTATGSRPHAPFCAGKAGGARQIAPAMSISFGAACLLLAALYLSGCDADGAMPESSLVTCQHSVLIPHHSYLHRCNILRRIGRRLESSGIYTAARGFDHRKRDGGNRYGRCANRSVSRSRGLSSLTTAQGSGRRG